MNFTHGLNYHTDSVLRDAQRFLIPRPEAALDADVAPPPITVAVNWIRALALTTRGDVYLTLDSGIPEAG